MSDTPIAPGQNTQKEHRGFVHTVAPGQPFLDVLARSILDGELPKPSGNKPAVLDLTHMTLLMPTRRAQRSLANAFLKASGKRAMLLPNIRPISERDEELALLTLFKDSNVARLDQRHSSALDIKPAIDPMQRVLLLSQLVTQWSRTMRASAANANDLTPAARTITAGAQTPAQAVHMAQELAQLMDLVEAEGVSLEDGLPGIVPDGLTHHWQLTLDFLKIITQFWPAQLVELDLLSPWQRQNRLILSEADRISKLSDCGPVIVAGVTGSIPATVSLMRAVLEHENGAIVLPGLDMLLDESSWQAITPGHPEHPQFGFKTLLDSLGLERSDVSVLEHTTSIGAYDPQSREARANFVSETFRPAATTELWHDYTKGSDRDVVAAGLAGVCLIEAENAFEEAETVALILREVADSPSKTAALVSPDRMLARRVAIRLKTWGIDVDDSAGRPFVKTVAGAYLDLVVASAAKRFAPPELMALLKHPLCRLGLPAREIRFAARALEIAAFRTTYIGRGLQGVEAALESAERDCISRERRDRAVARLRDEDWARAHDLVERLRDAFAPLDTLFASSDPHPLRALASAHLAAAESMSRTERHEDTEESEVPPGSPLFLREAGAFAAESFSSLMSESHAAPDMTARDYPDVYRSLIGQQNIRERSHVHPRLSIWGPIEARLQHADVMILGSLNDGVWPDSADPGPWLNRPMRRELGLPAPEEGIGRKAFDFTTFVAASEVIMTRAKKVDGVPSVPSRWLLRMRALLKGLGVEDTLRADTAWLSWARSRNETAGTRPLVTRPQPKPPVCARPRKLSVSSVETLIKNPYAIFASKILNLDPIPLLGQEPDAALRGNVMHKVLARFATEYPTDLPEDTYDKLIGISREVLTEYAGHPRVAAFWLTRFDRFANWFAESEKGRRNGLVRILAEVSGTLSFDAPAGPFILSARADRIDVLDRGLVITDYKTGHVPSHTNVVKGFAPQLPLEAAIAGAQGFGSVPEAPVCALRYIRASGAEPAGEEIVVKTDDAIALSARTLETLVALIGRFDDPDMAYACLRRHEFSYDYDDYAHLARVDEWSGSGGMSDGT